MPSNGPPWKLSRESKENLKGVHEHLVQVIERAIEISPLDFKVLEGTRSMKRQELLLSAGASTTLNSRHLTGHAVDLAVLLGGEVRWDWPLYRILWASGVYPAAQEIGVLVEWGGNWESFPDGGHFQLPWIAYPPVKEEPRNA